MGPMGGLRGGGPGAVGGTDEEAGAVRGAGERGRGVAVRMKRDCVECVERTQMGSGGVACESKPIGNRYGHSSCRRVNQCS